MKTTERELQLIGLRARNIVVAVSVACKGAGPTLNAQLQNDLTQLTKWANYLITARAAADLAMF